MQNHQTLIKNSEGISKAIVALVFGATEWYVDIVKDIENFTVKKHISFKMPIGVKYALIEEIDIETSNGNTTYTMDCIKGEDGVFLFTPSCIKIFSAKKLADVCNKEGYAPDKSGTVTVPDSLTRGFTTEFKIDEIGIVR